jgi:L-iditol 2-dehydrogenase
MNMQKTVFAWEIWAPNSIRLVQREIPVSPGRGLIRGIPLYIGICGSDSDLLRSGGQHSASKEIRPIIPGHELCAVVTALGEGVHDCGIKVGDVVVVEPSVPCDCCIDCARGNYNTCLETQYWGTPPTDGCFQQEVDFLPRWTYRVPEGMDPLIASLTEPLAACMEAVNRAGTIVEDEYLLIVGGGNIAMGLAFILSQLHRNIILAARSDSDLNFAANKLGIPHVVNLGRSDALEIIRQISNGLLTVAFECTGAEPVLQRIIDERVLVGYGKLVAVGCLGLTPVNIPLLRRSSLDFLPVRRSRRMFQRTLDFLAQHQEQARALIGKIGDFWHLNDVMLNKGGVSTGTAGPKTVIALSAQNGNQFS